ncbi:hypothetical protein BV25DRAFT_1919805 [Artomyces pyxidatus]|uniref:Uncharacterized protein n=1 Tax=Artomyces pyxidatus TaxID=48021 RepID=A0ACB8SQA3_9AGAM|nr:hypothetical protein BV25DRAFT_1919805 [Artomyces pyxidatus]
MQMGDEEGPAQVASPREANAQLPRPLEDTFYAVFVGRKLGVMATLWEAEAAIRDVPGGFYDIYPSHAAALANFRVAEEQGATSLRGTLPTARPATSREGPGAGAAAQEAQHLRSSQQLPLLSSFLLNEEGSGGRTRERAVRFDTPQPLRASAGSAPVPVSPPSPPASPPASPAPSPPASPAPSLPASSRPASPMQPVHLPSQAARVFPTPASRRTGGAPPPNFPAQRRRVAWSKRRPESLSECTGFENGRAQPSATWDEVKAYVVVKGGQPGIYESWDECKALVRGYPDGEHKSFRQYEDAVDHFLNKFDQGEVRIIRRV